MSISNTKLNGNGYSALGNIIPNILNQNQSSMSDANQLDRTSNLVVNLREIIENYAQKFFKENEKDYYKKIGKAVGWKDLVKEIDWKKLRVRHEKTDYQDVESPGKPKANVLFRSTFVNDSQKEQEYHLKTERKTVSSCDIEIFEGYVNEGSVELSLDIPIPGRVLSAGAGFKREYTMESTTNRSIEEEISWSAESHIKIPPMTSATAELVVKEDEYKGHFEIKTYFSGGVVIRLYKDSQELLIIELDDLDDIFTRDKGFRRDHKGLFRITRGECKARFGIEQKIELQQRPLITK